MGKGETSYIHLQPPTKDVSLLASGLVQVPPFR